MQKTFLKHTNFVAQGAFVYCPILLVREEMEKTKYASFSFSENLSYVKI